MLLGKLNKKPLVKTKIKLCNYNNAYRITNYIKDEMLN